MDTAGEAGRGFAVVAEEVRSLLMEQFVGDFSAIHRGSLESPDPARLRHSAGELRELRDSVQQRFAEGSNRITQNSVTEGDIDLF